MEYAKNVMHAITPNASRMEVALPSMSKTESSRTYSSQKRSSSV